MGALISKEHLAKVKGYVDLARKEGATINCGEGVDELVLPDKNKKVRSLFSHASGLLQCCTIQYWRRK